MKIGIILNTNNAEDGWNCFRLANQALQKGHAVKIFLLGKGVELEQTKDARFPLLQGAVKKFTKNGGTLLACGTCLNLRQKQESAICPVSSMDDLLEIVESSERLLSFG